MPYLDENGTIMIDDVAAENDIAKLSSAKASIENTKSIINQIIALNSTMSGPTATAIDESTSLFIKYLNVQSSNIDACVENIKQTVAKYHAIDEGLRDTINSTL